MIHPAITRRMIAIAVGNEFGLTIGEMTSGARGKRHVRARFAAWHLTKSLRPATSLVQLASMFGMDHTSVIRGLVRAKEIIDLEVNSSDFTDRIEAARGALLGWRPGDSLTDKLEVEAIPAAPEVKPPPVKLPVVPRAIIPPRKDWSFDVDEDRTRASIQSADARLFDAFRRAHPERIQTKLDAAE